MTDPGRLSWLWWFVIAVSLVAIPGPVTAQELEVAESDEPGLYQIDFGGGNAMEVALMIEGPPSIERSSDPECMNSVDFRLVVDGSDGAGREFDFSVPVENPSQVRKVRAVRSGNRVLLAISLEYHCSSSSRGREYSSDRWVVLEKSPSGVSLLQNSALTPGGDCGPFETRKVIPQIEPTLVVRGDELWGILGVRNGLCNSRAGEDRGAIEWKVGDAPEAAQLPFSKKLQPLILEAQALGFQPYIQFRLGDGITGVLAEVPTSMGAPRLLTLADRKGRSTGVLLPRFGYESRMRARPPDPSDLDFRVASILAVNQGQWPQLMAVEAFQYSESFLSDRGKPSVMTLLKSRKVSIVQLSLPCVDAIGPAPTGAENERWLFRVERNAESLFLEGALVEPCSEGWYGFSGETFRFLPGETEALDDRIQLTYHPPQVDLNVLALNKSLFDNIRDLNVRNSTAVIRMRLNGPTETIPRCESVLPTTGRGWLATETEGCRLNVQFGYGKRRYPEDQTPARFIEEPSISHWCAARGEKPEWRSVDVDLGADGAVKGYLRTYPSWPVPKELIGDIFGWRISPARDADGMPVAVTMRIDVGRGLPQSEQPTVCQ